MQQRCYPCHRCGNDPTGSLKISPFSFCRALESTVPGMKPKIFLDSSRVHEDQPCPINLTCINLFFDKHRFWYLFHPYPLVPSSQMMSVMMQMDKMTSNYFPEWGNETGTGSMPYQFFSFLPKPMIHRTGPQEQYRDEIPIPFEREEHRENRCKKKGEKEDRPFHTCHIQYIQIFQFFGH